MIDAAELVQMRADALMALPDTCVIQRDTLGASAFSAAGSAVASAIGTVSCRVRLLGPTSAEGETAGQIQSARQWAITLQHDADVRPDDRLLYGGRVFHVNGVGASQSWNVSKRALCSEINRGGQ